MRVHKINNKPKNRDGKYVLYWMVGSRRTRYNSALDRALYWCEKFGVPLLVFEPLRLDYDYASERTHSFLIQGMKDNAQTFDSKTISYYPFIEHTPGSGRGLLKAIAQDATLVVTDLTPVFFLPRMVKAAGKQLSLFVEAVDSVGLIPLALVEKTYPAAVHFRRFLQKNFLKAISEAPSRDSLDALKLFGKAVIPEHVIKKWGKMDRGALQQTYNHLNELPLDHHVRAGELSGGQVAALELLDRFVRMNLSEYDESRNHPDLCATSHLSAYLHFGHIGTQEIFASISEKEEWSPEKISDISRGQRSGWWGMSGSAEAFLDQLLVWRELSQSWAYLNPEWHNFNQLPSWARETLEQHANDPRETNYSLDQLENAKTHDVLWNAAQVQLINEGLLHGYLRMYWGKMILAWTSSPQKALERMLYLNDKFALDGRDPNSIAGCTWCLGRFDRPWWPERVVYGRVRYMSGINTQKKVKCAKYIDKYKK